MLFIWLAVKPLPNRWGWSLSHWLWPYPGGRLSYVFTVLLCVNLALACFLLLRRVNGVGYSIGWGHHWSFFILASFFVFGCIAIPLGRAIHFIEFAPQWSQLKSLPLVSLGILLFTAWPEELLFRGLLQNILSRASNSDLAGWRTASILFGFAHHQRRLSQLALCPPGLRRRLLLRLDLAQNQLHLRLCPGPRRRRHPVALPLSNRLAGVP